MTRGVTKLVRRALLAALIASPLSLAAEIAAQFDADTGAVHVTGLEGPDLNELLTSPEGIILRVAGASGARGTPFEVSDSAGALVITPRFALRLGTEYELMLDGETLPIVLPAPNAPTPKLGGISPSQGVIPANTLRMYLEFSEPMARGQIRDAVRLLDADGSEVQSPFLTLGPELWDVPQTRVTLLFDPGRVKQGVGPNAAVGPPLVAGESYRLVVGGAMQSAAGEMLGSDVEVSFRVGTAVRTPIDPTEWQVLIPPAGTRAHLTVAFDRIIDTGAVRRLVTLRDADGTEIRGHIETDGGGWSLTPERPWTPGDYTLVIDPELEDVSGNTPSVPFDAETGTIGTFQTAIERRITLLP